MTSWCRGGSSPVRTHAQDHSSGRRPELSRGGVTCKKALPPTRRFPCAGERGRLALNPPPTVAFGRRAGRLVVRRLCPVLVVPLRSALDTAPASEPASMARFSRQAADSGWPPGVFNSAGLRFRTVVTRKDIIGTAAYKYELADPHHDPLAAGLFGSRPDPPCSPSTGSGPARPAAGVSRERMIPISIS